jgi:hypothetical protein
MADAYTQLAQTLAAARQGAYQRNPYLAAANFQNTAQTPYGQAATSIIQGLLAGYGMKTAGEESSAMNKSVFDAVRSGNVNPLFEDPNLSDVGTALALQSADQDRQVKLLQAKADIDKTNNIEMEGIKSKGALQGKLLEAIGNAETPDQRAQAISIARTLGALPEGMEVPTGAPNAAGNIMNFPTGLRDDAVKEQAAQAEMGGVMKFIDDQFDRADQISTLETFDPTSVDRTAMDGIGTALTFQVDKIRGSEVNEGTREQVRKLLPTRWDTPDQSIEKRQRFKDFIMSQGKGMPLTGAMGPLGGANITDQQQQSLDPRAQALQILKQRGVIK